MEGMYNPLKLSQYLAKFGEKKVLIIGAGSVGTYISEFLAKTGVGIIHLLDFDFFTLENAAKHSGIIRTPEDVGKNKAIVTALRTEILMIPGGAAHGIDGNICSFGPSVISDYDVVFLAVDNFAAKLYFNKIWLELPSELRPVVIMGGTNDELAESYCLDGNGLCLRCLFDEAWLINSTKRTSCSGPQYRIIDGQSEIVRTSGLASGMAAHLMVEQFRALVVGCDDIVNRRIGYTAYPNFEMTPTEPMRRPSCPDCRIKPIKNVVLLDGSTIKSTLNNVFKQVEKTVGTDDFKLITHIMEYDGVGYGAFVTDDYCKACEKEMSLNAHESRISHNDVICPDCLEQNKTAIHNSDRAVGKTIRSFSPSKTPECLREMPLYQLGYPLGGQIQVILSGTVTDNPLDRNMKEFYFSMRGDVEEVALLDKI